MCFALRYLKTNNVDFLNQTRYFSIHQLPNCPHEAGWTPFQPCLIQLFYAADIPGGVQSINKLFQVVLQLIIERTELRQILSMELVGNCRHMFICIFFLFWSEGSVPKICKIIFKYHLFCKCRKVYNCMETEMTWFTFEIQCLREIYSIFLINCSILVGT